MTRFIDEHRGRFGVERICRVMGTNVSTYFAHKSRPPSARAIQDEWLRERIRQVHEANYSVYGIRKVCRALVREGIEIGRDHVARLMRAEGLRGVRRGRRVRTTIPSPSSIARSSRSSSSTPSGSRARRRAPSTTRRP